MRVEGIDAIEQRKRKLGALILGKPKEAVQHVLGRRHETTIALWGTAANEALTDCRSCPIRRASCSKAGDVRARNTGGASSCQSNTLAISCEALAPQAVARGTAPRCQNASASERSTRALRQTETCCWMAARQHRCRYLRPSQKPGRRFP
jgi:hypothetical protein